MQWSFSPLLRAEANHYQCDKRPTLLLFPPKLKLFDTKGEFLHQLNIIFLARPPTLIDTESSDRDPNKEYRRVKNLFSKMW